uniref:Uncharacterized protein n=1 Tax=Scophthalmus maximus TaxID=52904 RepID=A0A8D3BP59_SCOMX
MAPTDRDTLERQTSDIIRCLLEDEHVLSSFLKRLTWTIINRLCLYVELPAQSYLDPCLVPPQAAEAAFSHGVEALCKTRVSQGAEVAQEMQLIRASVDFGLYIKKSYPELKNKVQSAMTSFLNRRVGTWVAEQGGWVSVSQINCKNVMAYQHLLN